MVSHGWRRINPKRWMLIATIGILLIGMLDLRSSRAQAVKRLQLNIDLGDFKTAAELTYPADKHGPFPLVILVHGSGPFDMDATYATQDAQGKPVIVSHIFADIAGQLAANGIAVLRYNKHYVTGAGSYDPKFFTSTSLTIFADDLETVLKQAATLEQIDPQKIFLWGWSEGSVVAASIATQHPELAGLILQGPVGLSWPETVAYWFNDVAIPYLKEFAPDGKVTADVLNQALQGKGGSTALLMTQLMTDPRTSTPDKIVISSFLDTNHSGAIELDTELSKPVVDQLVAYLLSPQGLFGLYSPQAKDALPTVTEQADKLNMPVLILQGAKDGNTPPSGAQALEEALTKAHSNVTLKLYAELGHSLGKTEKNLYDNFAPIDPQPIADAVAWILSH